ncbi:MAG: LacI family DNA-binding transcriptional regulator [Lachnospiraceae bacterium]|nr:LacI family DNA-binding transcriptional regulator [Lachnospiraceae bacterium]
MAVSAKTIAKELGLSQATVSLALRNMSGISEDTRKKVLEKATELGYRKTVVSSADTSRFISLVIYRKYGLMGSDNPFFTLLAQAIDYEAKKAGYQVLISYFYSDQNIQDQLFALKNTACVGIILLATEMSDEDMALFQSIGIPMVVLDRNTPEFDYDSISINNSYGTQCATEYLIRMGHTKIGYLHCDIDVRNFHERMDGYYRGLAQLPHPKESSRFLINLPLDSEEMLPAMDAWLAANPELPTAFIADNDSTASPCVFALQRAGYRIPEDISIIGFDDIPLSKIMQPPLTTMAVSREQLGRHAVEFLIRRIEDNPEGTVCLQVKPVLTERGTVRKL